MRIVTSLVATALACATLVVRADPIDRTAWIAGCWRGETGGRVYEEQWMPPSAGLMLGMARTTANGKVASHESMRIEGDDERLVFTAKPSGKPEDSFVALPGDAERIVFENLAHPFPQRVIYAKGADGGLAARIEGKRDERLVGIDFPMRPVSCPTGHR